MANYQYLQKSIQKLLGESLKNLWTNVEGDIKNRETKETNDKINKLLTDNLLNDDAAEIRYNFVVGTTIKYLFVTEEQQQKLADGELAISFLGGKRALIPVAIAKQITDINPNKIVIIVEN